MTKKHTIQVICSWRASKMPLLMFRFIISSKSATYIIISRTPKRFYLKLQTFSAQLFDFDRAAVLVNS